MTRTFLAAAVALLAQCTTPAPALAQTVSADQAKAAASIASTFFTQPGNPLWACDPTQPDGLNPTYYDARNPDVVAARLDARDHYTRYGTREHRLPCEAQPASNVTRDHARAGLSTVTAFLAQPQVATVSPYAADPNRADGFNPIWYNHAYPDIVAAGVDPLQHFISTGVFEGRLPYQGATPFADEPLYSSKAPAPDVVMPAVYAAPGATSVRLPVCLQRHGKVAERSYTGSVYTSNAADGGGVYKEGQPLEASLILLPSSGGCASFTIPIPADQAGWFNAYFHTNDTPALGATARVYVNTAPPVGYAPLAIPAPTPAPLEPVITAWDYQDDFLGDLAAKGWQIGGYTEGLNYMTGLFIKPNARTVAGAHPDPYPVELVDGKPTRILRVVDQRADQVLDAAGKRHDWALPFLVLPQGVGAGVVQLTFAIYNSHQGNDIAWWSIKEGQIWPPEYDWFETWGDNASLTAHDNQAEFKQSARVPAAILDGKFHRMTVERTLDLRMHMWVDGVLVMDTPDYLRGQRMDTEFDIDGFAGTGGAFDPAFDYSKVGLALRGLALKRY